MSIIWRIFERLLRDEDAPTMAEYGLMLLFVALLVFASVVLLGQGLSALFSTSGAYFEDVKIPVIP